MRFLSAVALLWIAVTLTACHNAGSSPFAGEYVSAHNQDSHLAVDADTIQAGNGPFTLKFGYKTVSTDGNKTTIEMDDGHGHKDKATLKLDGDTLTVEGNFAVNGTWKRK